MEQSLNESSTNHDKSSRIMRLIWLMQEIRNNPRQEIESFIARAEISRSQFYKDKASLKEFGFSFEYKKGIGFHVVEDRLAPAQDLTLSDRLIIMFSLGHISAHGEGHLAAKALHVARKLASGLDEPFRSQVTEAFNQEVLNKSYSCDPSIFDFIQEAVSKGKRIRILYHSSRDWKTSWRVIDPLRLYFLQRYLYLYARTHDEGAKFKTYRISRIKEVKETGLFFDTCVDDGGFYRKLKNAFSCYIGDEVHQVTIRFQGDVIPFIVDTEWHFSQNIQWENESSILFSVKVAEPQEVVWWAKQFDGQLVATV